MPINTLEYAKTFQSELDKKMIENATSGWMEANAGTVIYNGGNEAKIPKVTMDGLADYDRDTGYVQGAVTLSYQTMTMTQDRGRKFQLDAMDVNESNFVLAAGTVMGEFQRTKVVPEVDSYRYSKLYSIAAAASKVNGAGYTPAVADILLKLKADIAAVQDIVGASEPLVITINALCASILDQANGITRFLSVIDFAQGAVKTSVASLDNIPIIKAPSGCMKTAYTVNDGTTAGQEAGGLTPAAGAKQINWLISARRSPIAVSKTDTMRIFDPMTNQDANAWKLDYRKYHDLWVPDNKKDGLWANVGA